MRAITLAIALVPVVMIAGAGHTQEQAAPEPTATSKALAGLPQAVAAAADRHFGQHCEFDAEYLPEQPTQSWPLVFIFPYDPPDQAAVKMTLHEIWCSSGAYNAITVYLLESEEGDVQTVSFAEPVFDVTYEDDDSEKAVEALTVKGMGTTDNLINAIFDPETYSLTSYAKWRGIGDAFSSGTWRFIEGRFVLTNFEVDASYNGEQDPITAYDASPDIP